MLFHQIYRPFALSFLYSFQYSDLSRCRLQYNLQLLKSSDGSAVKDDKVSVSNMCTLTMFRQMDIFLNQVLMTDGINTHWAYRGYLQAILTKSSQYLATHGQAELFEKDIADNFDETGFADGKGNVGLYRRFQRTQNGAILQIQSPLYSDLASMDQYLMSGVEVRVVFHPADPKLTLMKGTTTQTAYEYKASDFCLLWQHVEPTSAILLKHVQSMAEKPAIYNMQKTAIRSYSIPKFVKEWSLDSIFTTLPHTMIVGILNSENFQGKYDKSPWNFSHHDLESLTFNVENQQTILLQPDYANELYTSQYLDLVSDNEQTIIQQTDYPSGYCLYQLNLHPGVRRAHNNASAPASTRLNIRFTSALTDNLTIICFGIFSGQFKIDRAKNVYLIS